jgi:hypothetical protein
MLMLGRMLNVLPPTLDIAQYQQLKQETLRISSSSKLLMIDDQAALEALYEQFRCLASVEFKNDPMKLGAAIDRAAYSECVAYLEVGHNVIFDKVFEVYDTDKNGLIGFQEFVIGIHVLKKDQKRKLRCRSLP